MINPIDLHVIHLFNVYAQRSWAFDTVVETVADNVLLQGGVVTALLWWAWFRNAEDRPRNRELIISGVAMSFVALVITRTLSLILPFRERPMGVPSVHFHQPYGIENVALIHWSSFPSDHAALYFSLATVIFFASRSLGLLAYFHALVIVCLPRIYLGMHYPSDILAGAVLGVAITCLALIRPLSAAISRLPLAWLDRSPVYFYPCSYLVTFLLATNFDSVRQLVVVAWHAVSHSGHA